MEVKHNQPYLGDLISADGNTHNMSNKEETRAVLV